jgi:hypothetical protein
MKLRVLCALGVLFAPSATAATVSVRLDAATITAWTGAADSDPRGVAVFGDALYFFEAESISGPNPQNADHALIRYDLMTGAYATWYTEEELRVITGAFSGNFSADDVTVDDLGLVHVVARDLSTGVEHLVRVSNQGVGSEAVMGSAADGTLAIDFDPNAGRLYALTSTARGAASGGLEYIDFSTFPAVSYTQLASEEMLTAALTSAATPEWNPSDLVVQSDGDVIIFNGGPNIGSSGDLGSDGDCVRVTASGEVSLFFDRSLLDGLLGDPGTAGYGDTAIEITGFDEVLVLSFGEDPGGDTQVDEFLARVSADGSSAVLVTDEPQILSDLGMGSTDISHTANGLALDAGGEALWSSNSSSSPQGILQISDPVPARLTGFWIESDLP